MIFIDAVKDEYQFEREIPVNIGAEHSMSCNKIRGLAKWRFFYDSKLQWFFSKVNKLPRNRLPVHKMGTLRIQSFSYNMAGYYFCFSFNNFFKKYTWSSTRLIAYGN